MLFPILPGAVGASVARWPGLTTGLGSWEMLSNTASRGLLTGPLDRTRTVLQCNWFGRDPIHFIVGIQSMLEARNEHAEEPASTSPQGTVRPCPAPPQLGF